MFDDAPVDRFAGSQRLFDAFALGDISVHPNGRDDFAVRVANWYNDRFAEAAFTIFAPVKNFASPTHVRPYFRHDLILEARNIVRAVDDRR